MTSLRLFIAPTSPEAEAFYRAAADTYNQTPMAERSSGFDCLCEWSAATLADGRRYSYSTQTTEAIFVPQGCRAVALDDAGLPRAFWLAPRSSISKTTWMLANSMGLIDATYRGVLTAAVRSVGLGKELYPVRICQVAAADLVPWKEVIVVAELPAPETVRGEGGFGSTG